MAAIGTAARLEDIKFPEFTAKLINDTFDALIGANIRQMESFSELLEATSKTLSDYITDTKDEISLQEITDFLSALPVPNGTTGLDFIPTLEEDEDLTTVSLITNPDIDELNPDPALNPALSYGEVTDPLANDSTVKDLFDAVAERISFNKYQMLTTMVRMGALRLVVNNGVIETKLSFSTWDNQYSIQRESENKEKGFGLGISGNYGKKAVRGVGKYFKIAGALNYSDVKVNTSSNTQTSSSGTNINIMGRVEIHFKTDYQPLQNS